MKASIIYSFFIRFIINYDYIKQCLISYAYFLPTRVNHSELELAFLIVEFKVLPFDTLVFHGNCRLIQVNVLLLLR